MNAETKYPAAYRILLRGFLDKDWSDRLNGLTISTTSEEDESFTILEGPLEDEEALSGVLSTLHDLGYALLSVDRLSR
jgi:hypothetical protein